MSRSSTSVLLQLGLLATMLVALPTRLHAATNPQSSLNNRAATAALQSTKIANLVPTEIASSEQLLTQSKPNTGLPVAEILTSDASKAVTAKTAQTTALEQPKPVSTVKPAVTTASSSTQQPVQDAVNLILKLNEKQVYVYQGDKVIAKYPVAIGKQGWETPTGEWYVMEKIKNPAWTSFKNGKVTAAGKNNPLGERWIGFWTDGKDVIGFHGTSDVKSIGKAASHGCVRMLNKHVKALFPLVKVGTTVKVVSE